MSLLARQNAKFLVVYTLLFLFSTIAIFPLIWTLSCALKTPEETYVYPPRLIPQKPVLDNFYKLFFQEVRVGHGNMLTATLNSLNVTLPSVTICLIISIFGGYSLSRTRAKFKSWGIFLIFFVQLLPLIVLTVPFYIWFAGMGLIDKTAVLIIAYHSFLLPLSIAFMKDYFDSIPKELEEAAMIDGCSRFGVLIRITLPLALPGLASIAIYAFLHAWEEYLLASVLLLSPNNRTVPLQLVSFIEEYMIDWGGIMAAAIWTMIPVLLIFIFVQKYFVAGLTAGALKA